jgi:outer membrane receptor protein involved in Fe transport
LVGDVTIAKFANTTAAAPSSQADIPMAERANYFDVGVEQKLSDAISLGIDSYYKKSRNLIDEGQFGAPIILTPFNYRDGRQYGLELTASYTNGPFSAYGNLAFQSAMAKDIVAAQFNFAPNDLAYIAQHYINLDHAQRMTASAGASYLWRGTRFSGDLLFGSGLRADLVRPDGSSVPNGAHLPYYTQVNLGVSHEFDLARGGSLTARIDIINAFDHVYEIRDGTGIGVGAPQFGPRRGVFVGLSKSL